MCYYTLFKKNERFKMTITDEEREQFIIDLKERYSYITPELEDEEINRAIDRVLEFIPTRCDKKMRILEYMTLHEIIVYRMHKNSAERGDYRPLEDIIEVRATGDISTKFSKDTVLGKFDPYYNQSLFGVDAKILLKKCVRGIIGIIY
jgi:hypothetical protein